MGGKCGPLGGLWETGRERQGGQKQAPPPPPQRVPETQTHVPAQRPLLGAAPAHCRPSGVLVQATCPSGRSPEKQPAEGAGTRGRAQPCGERAGGGDVEGRPGVRGCWPEAPPPAVTSPAGVRDSCQRLLSNAQFLELTCGVLRFYSSRLENPVIPRGGTWGQSRRSPQSACVVCSRLTPGCGSEGASDTEREAV